MSTHTPGKWIARKDPAGGSLDYCVGLDDDCSPVDYIAACSKRDARLIAAAPTMLAALQKIDAHGYTTGGDYDMVRAAIAKATQA